MKKVLAVMLAPLILGACSFGRMKPGLTKAGAAVAVSASTIEEARRLVVGDAVELFLASSSSMSVKTTEAFAARASDFTGRERFKKGKGSIELKFSRFLIDLDKEGLLRPEGFTSREPRVLLLVSEPQGILDLGVGPAADALRRGLSAYGMSAIDGRDALNDFLSKGKDPDALAAGAARLGADWMLIAAASASAELDPVTRSWRGRATLIADQYKVTSSTPLAQFQSSASVLDVSSVSARGKALDNAGEETASKVAAAIKQSLGGRSEGAVFVLGGSDLNRLKRLIVDLRAVEGVDGAYLGIWRGEEESVVLRVFLTGLKIDGLAARLLRRDPSVTLLSVEPGSGRLAVELSGRSFE
ncbi:MAG: hypothetical protein COV48_14315 [Elusimicrobia bacterium CG11_big_fil_rev_8_21_14_0_20_64_6]|nr:MAG: hypothetical protein COV48_14315 [Elusimicrobia bacterium CG11_big_fil_rev_8_21_14_0_20_64_6]